jgi:hypothetical protein
MQPERIPEALFFCLQFFIPLLLGVRVLKLELTRLNYRALVIAANNTLLIAGILTFGILFYEFVAAFYSGTDYEAPLACLHGLPCLARLLFRK